MFERCTNRARWVVVLAHEEARMLDHNYLGTGHILLGLIHDGEGAAAKALQRLGISLEAVRPKVEEIIGQGQQAPSGHIPVTPRAKKVLELSAREAKELGHKHIGTRYLLLGLICERKGVAAQALVQLGADLATVKQQVIQQLSTYGNHEGTSAVEQELVDEELELPDEELTERCVPIQRPDRGNPHAPQRHRRTIGTDHQANAVRQTTAALLGGALDVESVVRAGFAPIDASLVLATVVA